MTVKILVTNDDGIDSPGLKAAVEAVMGLGEVTVIAPTSQQTATGRGLTGNMNSSFTPIDQYVAGTKTIRAFHCDCSPALIVRHAMRTVYRSVKPDLLVSGINYGENLGATITCSGTVGAALEGASSGVPSIAISKQTDVASHHRYTDQDWSVTQYFLKQFARILLRTEPQFDVDALKIDVPAEATIESEWELTTMARTEYYTKSFTNPGWDSKLNEGTTIVNIGNKTIEPGSDVNALAIKNNISVTPLSIDLTSRVNFASLRDLYRKA